MTKMAALWSMVLALASPLLMAHANVPLNARTSYFGNSFPGTPHNLHVQDDILALSVTPDGTCYTDSTWDEGGQEAGIYKEGKVVGTCASLHGWGRNGGAAITTAGNFVYVAITQNGDDGANAARNSNGLPNYPAANHIWYCIRRYTLTGTAAPFPTGTGFDGSMLIVDQGVQPDSHTPYSGAGVAGIAADANTLYVSDPTANQIKCYSLRTLSPTPIQTWSLARPGPMTTGNGSLFVIQDGKTPSVRQYRPDGTLLHTLTFAAGVKPSALAYDAATHTLLVADQGPDQNVKEYRLADLTGTPTKVTATFGVKGGVFAGRGAQIGTVGPRRFNNPTGVGVDSRGNVYVAQDGTCNVGYGGGAVLESYAPNRHRNWQLYDLEFIDCADVDPAAEQNVYTKEEHFVMNYSHTAPGSEATYHAYTINRIKYPEDARLHQGTGNEAGAWVRRFRGHRFLITTDMYSNYLCLYRFDAVTDGQCAIPSVVFSQGHHAPDSTGWPENEPSAGEWIWRDANGNGKLDAGEFAQPSPAASAPSTWGWWVDSHGDVWQATQHQGIRHFVCQGLDRHGNPIYDFHHMTTTPMPSPLNDLERIEYFPATDTMYLSGYSTAQPNNHGYWKIVGKVICRYDHWSTHPVLHSGYPLLPPFSDTITLQQFPASMDVAGSFLFIADVKQAQVEVFSTDTGRQVGTIFPGPTVGGLGWVDVPYGICAYRRANGEYLIFVEDDWHGKIVLYRWKPVP